MKALFFLSLFGIAATQSVIAGPIISHVPVNSVFAPKGFDTNDMAEIVISGHLPSLCYKSPIVKTRVENNVIHVDVYALNTEQDDGLECTRMVVPFLIPVEVGVLDRGKYLVKVNENSGHDKNEELFVSEALSSAIDEHVYAYVENVLIKPGSREITLKGYNPSDCYQFDRVDFVSNGKNVYSVLPKMKQVDHYCPRKMVPFTIETKVPDSLSEKELLLHVRAMHGKSVNALFYQ